jgi:hypothetical protein
VELGLRLASALLDMGAGRTTPNARSGPCRCWRRSATTAARWKTDRAEPLAREAVGWAEQTDSLRGQADAYLDLAEVLALGHRGAEAATAAEHAAELYERKGIPGMAERARGMIGAAPMTPLQT